MLAFLEFAFRDLPHFIGVIIMMIIVSITLESLAATIVKGFNRSDKK